MSTKQIFSALVRKCFFYMTERLDISSNDFITRDDFVEWVLDPTPELDVYWRQFLHDNPSSKADIDEAIFIIKNIIPDEKQLDNGKLEKLWDSIEEGTVRGNRSKKSFKWSVAAAVAVLVGISTLFYFSKNEENKLIDYRSVAKTGEGSDEVKLIFSDHSEKTFSSNELEIKYNTDGGIEVITGTGKNPTNITKEVLDTKDDEQKKAPVSISKSSSQEQLNQLVVPKGKRTSLILSDGTRLYLNSGSRAIFPVKFAREKRELFIEGEAYIEVAHDSKRPFIAVINEMSVRVLGTKFNISAYPEDSYCSIVLVEGHVQAEVNSGKIVLDPNHLLVYQKSTKEISLEKTEVLPYISWKDGWLYCKKEKLSVVASKLSRYYDIQIEFEDKETPELILNGKLDLKSECSDIFKAISSIASISCEIKENKIIVSKKRDNN